jgi:hydrogenase-4 component B
MDAIQLLLLSIILYAGAALAALFLNKPGGIARIAAGWLGLLASLAGVASAGLALMAASTPEISLFQIAPFGWCVLQIDKLSAFMVGLIALISAASSLYSLSTEQGQGVVGFFTHLFVATMLLVVTVMNAFYFLLFWEMMTLASYFLVIWETEKEDAIQTGYIYMLIAHAGAALIMLAFFVLFQKTDSFDFRIWRQAWVSPGVKNLAFLLVFIGFGAKAGMVPLHFWTPGAYSAAPNHVSALMSGVMKKTAIYGILRICVDLMGVQAWWWGVVLLAFGVFSAILGAFYALAEKDIKRLLAYSSVENVGIMLMGAGVGMVGLAIGEPTLAALGLLATLYHALNHAFFKGLLYLGAGAVADRIGTQNLNQMGGLARRMPWTALTFLIGAMAVAAIPPLNGFVSEWFIYQSFFSVAQTPLLLMRVFGPLLAVMLAMAGAFAVMVYIKAYGGAFTGPARSQPAADAKEAPRGALAGMVYLAIGCLALGIGAPLVAPLIAGVAVSFARIPQLTVSNGWQVFPGDWAQAVLSPPLVAILLLGLFTAPLLVAALYGGFRAGRRTGVDPWACGYGYSARMSVAASSFDQPVKVTFHPLYWLRTIVDKPFRAIKDYSQMGLKAILRAEPVVEMVVTRPTTRVVEMAGQWIQALQMGDIRVYCLYIILTLAILLIVLFGGGGL